MGKLQERMIEDLKLSGYSATTRRIYVLYATRFARYFRRPPETMGERELRRYFLYLLDERQVSHNTYRQAYSALKFLYTVTLRRRFEIPCLPRNRRPRPLPEVLSGSEVRRLLEAFRSAKYRMLVMTMYGAGLRVSEACRLRPADIDARRMLIHVHLGKGKKDRFVALSRRLLEALRVYWRMYRPQDYFFPGRDVGPISPKSVRTAVHCAVKPVTTEESRGGLSASPHATESRGGRQPVPSPFDSRRPCRPFRSPFAAALADPVKRSLWTTHMCPNPCCSGPQDRPAFETNPRAVSGSKARLPPDHRRKQCQFRDSVSSCTSTEPQSCSSI